MLSFISIARVSILISLFVLTSCSTGVSVPTPKVKKSHDLLPEGVFTPGIEGPAVDKNGVLYAVNYQRDGTIGKVTVNQAQQVTTGLFAHLPGGSIGNGIRIDQQGVMYVADYIGHNVYKKTDVNSGFVVHAHSNAMNQPNDLAIMDNGILFASDPDWQNKTGHVWRINPDGKTYLVAKRMGTTNGIEVSPDNKRLYVNESVQRKIWVYDLNERGRIKNKRLFYSFDEHGLDGMRCDVKGNLYIARYDAGEVIVLSPDGVLLYTVMLKGKKPTNVAFGGRDGKTVFVTLQDRGTIEYFTADFPGREFAMLQAEKNKE
ncbi:Gluconolactonase [Thalassocella blandensis]|nr:Gluconolactonase [Thalassocella blandensis]